MSTVTTAAPATATASATRWNQLIFVIICMVLIANLQYGWTLFVNPMNKAHGWSIAAIQFAFAIFIALETWLTPILGWAVRRARTEPRAEARGGVRRPHGGARMGHQCACREPDDALSRRG